MTLLTKSQKPEIIKYTVFTLTLILLGLSFSNNVYAEINVDEQYFYELGNTMIITGELIGYDSFLFKENGIEQDPIKIDISNTQDNNPDHVFHIQVFPNCVNGSYPNCDYTFDTSLSLSRDVGFTDGIYNISISYSTDVTSYQFGIDNHFIEAIKSTNLKNNDNEIVDKIFTINIDKQEYTFGDRMLLTGFLEGYTTDSIYDRTAIKIQILDQHKQLLESQFHSKTTTSIPSLYDFQALPRMGDGYAAKQKIGGDYLDTLEPNQYRTSVSITPLDFIQNQTYYVVATYEKEKREIPFIVYDKFANMVDIFEIYLIETNYALNNTVTITGLAPYAVGGTSSSSTITGSTYGQLKDDDDEFVLDDDGNTIDDLDQHIAFTRDRSSSTGDSHHVMFSILRPDGEKEIGQVEVKNGEFTIEYQTPIFSQSENPIDRYYLEVQWTSHYQYLDFVVSNSDTVVKHDCEKQREFIEFREKTYQDILDNADLLVKESDKYEELKRAENYKLKQLDPYPYTIDCI